MLSFPLQRQGAVSQTTFFRVLTWDREMTVMFRRGVFLSGAWSKCAKTADPSSFKLSISVQNRKQEAPEETVLRNSMKRFRCSDVTDTSKESEMNVR